LEPYDNSFWGFSNGGKKRDEKICKIVAYGCQTPSAQRRSDQFLTCPLQYQAMQLWLTRCLRIK
jgi:hypothetical protein